MKELQS